MAIREVIDQRRLQSFKEKLNIGIKGIRVAELAKVLAQVVTMKDYLWTCIWMICLKDI
jgi:hypothetical protein